jgi:hypothetical protein
MAEKWISNTEQNGFPIYKYPFWFWDEGKAEKNYCNPLSFPSSNDIYACAVWHDKPTDKVGFLTWSPTYMEDHAALSAPSDMEMVDPADVPTPISEAHNPETFREQKRRADTASGMSTVYLLAGVVGAAILYKVYKKKK